jgi:hypothetical protein
MATTVTIDDDLDLRGREITGATSRPPSRGSARRGSSPRGGDVHLLLSTAPPGSAAVDKRSSTRDGRSQVGCRLEPRMMHMGPAPGPG